MEDGDARDRGEEFLGLWRAAADRIAQTATRNRQGAGSRYSGRRHPAQSPTAIAHRVAGHPAACRQRIRTIVERVYPLGEASEALRQLIEDRPFGKVVLAG
jgi:NADPH:quinone reductase-like Zn-dependent oxidoreductase